MFKTDSKRTANGQQTLTADQQKVLQLLEEGEKSILELMAVCGYKKRESFRNSVLNDLIDRNIVAMTHPENISHRNQRYIKVDQGTGPCCRQSSIINQSPNNQRKYSFFRDFLAILRNNVYICAKI